MIDRALLKEVGHTLRTLGFIADARALAGATRLESLRTIYRFEDGVCVEVERRRDCALLDARLVGMRLVGFLVGDRLLCHRWEQGARGVLWRMHGPSGTVAMTTPTFAFVLDRYKNMQAAAPANEPPARPPMQSQTRVHMPRAALLTA